MNWKAKMQKLEDELKSKELAEGLNNFRLQEYSNLYFDDYENGTKLKRILNCDYVGKIAQNSNQIIKESPTAVRDLETNENFRCLTETKSGSTSSSRTSKETIIKKSGNNSTSETDDTASENVLNYFNYPVCAPSGNTEDKASQTNVHIDAGLNNVIELPETYASVTDEQRQTTLNTIKSTFTKSKIIPRSQLLTPLLNKYLAPENKEGEPNLKLNLSHKDVIVDSISTLETAKSNVIQVLNEQMTMLRKCKIHSNAEVCANSLEHLKLANDAKRKQLIKESIQKMREQIDQLEELEGKSIV